MSDKERAEFESWAPSYFELKVLRKDESGQFLYDEADSALATWQASAARSANRIAELEAEVARLKADADRYNWLKAQSEQGEYFIMSGFVGTWGECGHMHVYDDLADEWIDEAMKGGV